MELALPGKVLEGLHEVDKKIIWNTERICTNCRFCVQHCYFVVYFICITIYNCTNANAQMLLFSMLSRMSDFLMRACHDGCVCVRHCHLLLAVSHHCLGSILGQDMRESCKLLGFRWWWFSTGSPVSITTKLASDSLAPIW